jgi:hypothetical protein
LFIPGCRVEQVKAKRQENGASPVGEKSEVPDAHEAFATGAGARIHQAKRADDLEPCMPPDFLAFVWVP